MASLLGRYPWHMQHAVLTEHRVQQYQYKPPQSDFQLSSFHGACRVLDVGCGCGFIAACAAVLAGKPGTVVGVDIKPACIKLSQDNIDRLRDSSNR